MCEIKNKNVYQEEIEESLKTIIQVYLRIVIDYLHFMMKTEKLKKAKCFSFILFRGLETMTHVFNYILFCTKNLDAAENYAEKSMFYYVEFISQITEVNHTFLQFTSRDAVIYVYKKTIYEIKNNFILESSEKTKKMCHNVNMFTQIIKNSASSNNEELLSKFVIDKFKQLGSKIKTVESLHSLEQFQDMVSDFSKKQ